MIVFTDDVVGGQSHDALTQNILFNKIGKLIPRFTMPQITQYKKRHIVHESDFKDMFKHKNNDDISPTEYIRTYCQTKSITFNPISTILSYLLNKHMILT